MEPSPYKDEIDWKDLIRKPEKLFGYSYIYIFAVLLGIGMVYLWNLNAAHMNAVEPAVIADSAAFVQDIPLRSPRVLPPVDVMKAGVSSQDLVNKGRDLFKANCAACHGEDGQGDGPSAALLNPKPRDFHSLAGWKNGSRVTQIYKTLEEGVAGSGMASYKYMPPEDRFALIHYVRSFASGQPQDSAAALRGLDSVYHLSQGMNIAGQVPIRLAMKFIERENRPLSTTVQVAMQRTAAAHTPGAELFRNMATDESRVFASATHARKSDATVDRFIEIVSANPIQFGFRPEVVRLSEAEWRDLYQYTYSILRKEE